MWGSIGETCMGTLRVNEGDDQVTYAKLRMGGI